MRKRFLFFSAVFFSLSGFGAESVLPSIIVKGQRTPTETDAEVIERVVPIENLKENRISDTLRSEPSISVREAGAAEGPTWISIRGQDPSQTRWFIESIPLTESEYQRSPLSFLTSDFFSEVKIYPSAAPASLMSDGMGGAVQVKLPAAQSKRSVSLRGGSYQFLKGSFHESWGRGALGAVLTRSEENFSYFDSNGTPYNPGDDSFSDRQNNGFWRASFFPSVTWYESLRALGRGLAIVSVGETGLPGSVGRPEETRVKDKFVLIGHIDDRKLSASDALESSLYVHYSEEDLAGTFALSHWVPRRTISWTGGGRSSWSHSFHDDLKTETSVGAQYEQFSPILDSGESPSHAKLHIPLSLSARWEPISRLYFQPALSSGVFLFSADEDVRVASQSVAGELRDQSLFLISPRMGAGYSTSLGGGVLRFQGSIGNYQRAPSLLEWYGSTWGVAPSPGLKEESAWKAEVEAQWEIKPSQGVLRSLKLGYAFHTSRSENLIIFVPNSPETRIAQNIGKALILGNEVSLGAKTRWGIVGKASYSHLFSENLTDSVSQNGKALPGRGSQARFDLGFEGDVVEISYGVVWRGENYLDLANGTRLPSSSEHGIFARVSTKNWGAFAFDLRNLWDQKTLQAFSGQVPVTEISSGISGYPSPGRRAYFTWRYTL